MEKNMNNLNQPQTTTNNKTSMTDKIGDAVEKVGHKISDMGLGGIGKKIHDLGDKLEETHTNPNHSEDV